MLIEAVVSASKVRKSQQVLFFAEILLGPAALLGFIFYLFRLWRMKAGKTEG
jgi:hypothetical protein